MTPRDFAYWLQGLFELTAATLPAGTLTLTPLQIDCIRKHIALVYTTHPGDAFVRSIEAVLERAPEAVEPLLAAHFEHVIDPAHPDPVKANAAHFGGRPPGGDHLIRC